VRPYQPDTNYEEGGQDNADSEHSCCPVLSCSFTTESDAASFFAMIDSDGQMVDFLRLKYLLWRRNSRKENERLAKVGVISVYLLLLSILGLRMHLSETIL